MEKFQNRYRIQSTRAPFWNYSNNGSYFITICTAEREQILGSISNRKMQLSAIGEIVEQEWEKSFDMRKELFCDAFVIMPDHLHAILRIETPDIDNLFPVDTHGPSIVDTHGPSIVDTHGRAYQQQDNPVNYGVAYRPPKSISSFVAGFKSAATKRINKMRNSPGKPVWQSRFHDHIIRNKDEYWRITNYIKRNPENWGNDKP